MPEGCLMGSGAEASEVLPPPPPHVSMCSTVDTSMGCSPEQLVGSRDVLPVSVGPRGQQSPPTNFTGLWKKKRREKLRLFLWATVCDAAAHIFKGSRGSHTCRTAVTKRVIFQRETYLERTWKLKENYSKTSNGQVWMAWCLIDVIVQTADIRHKFITFLYLPDN